MALKKFQTGCEIDYTNPSSSVVVSAGDAVASGWLIGVPNSDIAASRQGALCIDEAWTADKTVSGSVVFTAFTDPVWINTSTDKGVDSPGTNTVLGGICIASAADADSTVSFVRVPALAASAPLLISYAAADLAANTALAATYIGWAPRGGRLASVKLASRGTAAGIDNSNTLVVAIKDGSGNTIVTYTFNATNTFPANGAMVDLGALSATYRNLAAGTGWTLTVTSSTNANPPAFDIISEFIPLP